MIILNDLKVKTKFQTRLQSYKTTLNFTCLECPCCHSKEYILWGTYERGIVYLKNNILHSEIVIIQRIRCKSCKKTHALLPFGIIPYKQLTDEVMIELLSQDEDSSYYSDETLRTYKKQFKKTVYPYLITILKTSSITSIFKNLKTHRNEILTKFIEITGHCFMQIKLGNIGMCSL